MSPYEYGSGRGALRRGTNEDGRFDLHKAVFVEVVPCDLRHLVPQENVSLQIGTAQVEVAVFQSRQLRRVAVLDNLKGRRFACGQHTQILYLQLHLTRGNLGVFRGAFPHDAFRHQDILIACGKGFFKNRTVGALVKGKLYNPRAVTQVDENQCAQITLALYPTCNGNLFADVCKAQFAAIHGSLESRHKIHFYSSKPNKAFISNSSPSSAMSTILSTKSSAGISVISPVCIFFSG